MMECEVALEGTHEVLSCCWLTPACKQVLVANRTRNLSWTTIAHQLRTYFSNKIHSQALCRGRALGKSCWCLWPWRRCMFKSGPLLLKGILLHLTSHSNPALKGRMPEANVWAKWDVVKYHIVEPRKSEIWVWADWFQHRIEMSAQIGSGKAILRRAKWLRCFAKVRVLCFLWSSFPEISSETEKGTWETSSESFQM